MLSTLLISALLVAISEPTEEQKSFEIRLDNAVLEIARGPDLEISMIRAPGSPDAPALEVVEEATRLLLQRSDPERSTDRIHLILELPNDRGLAVQGRDLDLVIRQTDNPTEELDNEIPDFGEGEPEPEEENEDERSDDFDDLRRKQLEDLDVDLEEQPQHDDNNPSSPVHVRASESKIGLFGVPDIKIESYSSRFQITGGDGAVEIVSELGFIDINQRSGRIDFESTDDTVELDSSQATISFVGRGSEIDLSTTEGALEIQLDDAFFRSLAHQGTAVLRSRSSTVEFAGGVDVMSRFDFQVEDSNLTIDSLEGTIQWVAVGGQLEGSRSNVRGTVTASQGAVVELSRMTGPLTLNLSSQSEARIENLDQRLAATVQDSSLQASGARSVQLTSQNSTINLSDIEQLGRANLTDSTTELDLTDISNNPTVVLAGTTSATILLSSPCLVQTQGQAQAFDQEIEIFGCELRAPGQATRSARHRLQYPAGVRILKVQADASSSLTVEGQL